MSPTTRRPYTTILNLAEAKIKSATALAIFLMLPAVCSIAQQPTTTPPADSAGNSRAEASTGRPTASVVAGTRIALVLTQPIQTRYLHRGDDIFAQTTSPVTSGNEVVIPPGTFVQGKIDKIERQGARGEVRLQSLSITFPDGYVTPVAGPVTLESDDGYAIKDPVKGRVIAAVALPVGGVGVGALIGHLAGSKDSTLTNSLPPGCTGPPPGCLSTTLTEVGSGAKNTVIGAAIGGVAGAVLSIAVLVSSHNFYLEVGSPVTMVLHQPIVLPEDEVADAIRDAEQHPASEQPVIPRSQPTPPANDSTTGPTWCQTPGTPGTPDVDIPGTPATADSPGTPPIHIPGIPATPPSTHLCP